MTVMLFFLYMPGQTHNPSYHVDMKWFPIALLLSTAILAAEMPQLKQVQSVYILPMSSGMDQYLANKIVRQGLFQVLTDPQKADAILTDRIGEPFERKLQELYPPPSKKVVKEKEGTDDKDPDKERPAAKSENVCFGCARRAVGTDNARATSTRVLRTGTSFCAALRSAN